MLNQILIYCMYLVTAGMTLLVFFVFRNAYKTEKQKKKFEYQMKIGDKCNVHLTGSYDAIITNIEDNIVTIELKRHSSCLYPSKEKK